MNKYPINPMLAQSYDKYGHKIKYPCYAQPKLDGIRCIAINNNGVWSLWTRNKKPINSVPHIIKQLEKLTELKNIVFDGELYNHNYKNNFETIVSIVRQQTPDPNHTIIEYHIYDIVSNELFKERIKKLNNLKSYFHNTNIIAVKTKIINNHEDAMSLFFKWNDNGYEGIILRNIEGLYINKRSIDLQKLKILNDDEFNIIGIEEGQGKLKGCVGSFICKTKNGKQFYVKMACEIEKLKDYFNDHSLWKNKLLTVRFQGLTNTNNIPRFPIGIAIRDYE